MQTYTLALVLGLLLAMKKSLRASLLNQLFNIQPHNIWQEETASNGGSMLAGPGFLMDVPTVKKEGARHLETTSLAYTWTLFRQ